MFLYIIRFIAEIHPYSYEVRSCNLAACKQMKRKAGGVIQSRYEDVRTKGANGLSQSKAKSLRMEMGGGGWEARQGELQV